MSSFPFYRQADAKDCGPTCLKIVAKHFGKIIDIQFLRELSETTREESNLLLLSEAAEKMGFRTLGARLSAQKLQEATLPCLLFWNSATMWYYTKLKKEYIIFPILHTDCLNIALKIFSNAGSVTMPRNLRKKV